MGSPAGVLFIPKVIYEYGEPWWNDVDRGKLSICPPELPGNPTGRVIWWQTVNVFLSALITIFIKKALIFFFSI
jgi:hypothetical protein